MTGYESKRAAAQAIDKVHWVDHEPDGRRAAAQDKLVQWANEAFNDWWDSDYDDSTNPYEKDTFAYWAWAGWTAALAQPEKTLPRGIGDGLVAIKTLLSRDPCVHANKAIQMIDAIIAEQPAQQEPVAWMSSDKAWMWSDYSKALAAVAHNPRLTLIPLYIAPPQRTEQNFCPRCGKRTQDIHTCTPPQEKETQCISPTTTP